MVTRDDILNNLKNEKKDLENKIKYRRLYNMRNNAMRDAVKTAKAANFVLPIILTSAVCLYPFHLKKNMPFTRDVLYNNVVVETIDTSSDLHITLESSDYKYDKEKLEYSTGWKINKDGVYERTLTTYKVSDNIDLNDTDSIFGMSKEELEGIVSIVDVKTIKKSKLSAEDDLYYDDCIMVTNHKELDTKKEHTETEDENILNSLLYIMMAIGMGYWISKGTNFVEKKLLKKSFDDFLKDKLAVLHDITEEDVENYKVILAMKKENLDFLTNNNGNSYSLRKNKGDNNE